MTAAPLRCAKCHAPVPLASSHAFSCPFCGARVTVPADYRQLFELHAQEAETRKTLEHDYASAARPPSRRIDIVAALLVLVAPSLAAGIWVARSEHALRIASVFAGVIVPALLPGVALWIWSASVHATIVRFQLALACDLGADAHPLCRVCGAPLATPAGAIFARCAYCGSDSLIADVTRATRSLRTRLREDLRTLAEAIIALRIRRRLLVAGIAVAAAGLAALAVLLVAARSRY
jgi:DNA-directed RNA polymerase subunit RPC12/RpoP